MKKLTKKSLDELAQTLSVIGEAKQKTYVGGGNGTSASPYTTKEFNYMLDHDQWQGGFVEGMGYVANDANVYGNYKSPLTVTQSFYTFPDYIKSLSSSTLEIVIEYALGKGLPAGFDIPLEIRNYLREQYGNMTRDIQYELMIKGGTATSSYTLVRVPAPITNGSTNSFTYSVYDVDTGEFLTAREFNMFGWWNKPSGY